MTAALRRPSGASRTPSRDEPDAGDEGGGAPFDRRLAGLPTVRTTLAASVALGLAATASVVVQAVAIGRLLASAMPGGHPAGRAGDLTALGAALAGRALIALFAEPMARLGAAGAKADLRTRLVHAVVARAPAEHRYAPADVAALAGRGLDGLDPYLSRCLPDLVLAALAPVVLLIAVGIMDWLSAVVLAVAVALFPLFGALVGRTAGRLARDRWRQVGVLSRQVVDVFEGLGVLRAFGRSAGQRARIAQADTALRDASLRTLRLAFLSALVLDTLASVSVAMVAVPLGLRLLHGGVALPAALAVLVVAPEVLVPLRRASAEFHESTEGLTAASRAFALLDMDAALPPVGTAAAPDPAGAPVRLEDVHVRRAGRARAVLDGASLCIAPGERVALVGANGTGKSTVAALLLGFLAPTAGAVTVGGQDLERVDLDGWRRHITYLPAEPAILAGTLAENLRLATPAADDAELLDALAGVGAASLVTALPEGLATRIGPGGRPLSAGERQRIALARTLLRPASLYVLDEPTVHLDARAESLAVRALDRATSGKSALFITHHRSVMTLADRIVAIEAGRIVPVDRRGRPPDSPAVTDATGNPALRGALVAS